MSAATDGAALASLLERAEDRRRAWGLPSAQTNAFRLLAGAADELPGCAIDRYGDFAVLHVYRDELERAEAVAAACLARGIRGVYLKRRPRQANALRERERQALAPPTPLVGEAAPDPLEVLENGVRFAVRLGDGLSTGLFLDQRENRARLRASCRGGSLLNLFAYTCGFGVAAAAFGAARTLNVDLSKSALERGKASYALNGVELAPHRFFARDVFDALRALARKGERFTHIVIDPPSYASSKRGRFRLEDDLPGLIEAALGLLLSGGSLLACGNDARLGASAFEALVQRGIRAAKRHADVVLCGAPPEHLNQGAEGTILRSAWVRCT